MINKKLGAIVLTTVLSASLLAGCGGKKEPATVPPSAETPAIETPAVETPSAEYKDGTYRVEYDQADTRGWKAFVEVAITDGKISAVTYDYVNADGNLKTQDASYNEAMKKTAGTNPEEAYPALAEALVQSQDINSVQAVTGATHSSETFKEFATLALKNAKDGNAGVVTVTQPDVAKVEYKDGTYKVEYDKADTRGWKAFVEVVIAEGKISNVTYDYINADGNLKTKDAGYNESMKKTAGTNPEEAYPALSQMVVDNQGLNGFEVVTGATHSSETFKEFIEKALKASQAGETAVIFVPQPDVK